MRSIELRIFLTIFIACAFFTNTYFTTNDASRFALTVSLTKHASAEISSTLPRVISPGWRIKDFARVGDKIHSDKAPLGSFLSVPDFWIISKFTNSLPLTAFLISLLSTGLITAVTCALIWRLGASFTESAPLRAAVALSYGLGSMALFYGTVFFSNAITAFLCLLSFHFIRAARDGGRRVFNPIAAGVCASLAVSSDYFAAIPAACLLAYAFSPRREFAIVAASFFAALIPLLVYNTVLFGGPLTLPYRYSYLYESLHSSGLYGIGAPSLKQLSSMLFSKWGFFFCNPLAILSLALMPRFFRHPREGMFVVIAFAGLLYLNSCVGWLDAYSARFFTPVLPFLFLPLMKLDTKRKPELIAFAALAAVSVVITIIGADMALPEFYGENVPGAQNVVGAFLLKRGTNPGWFSLIPLFAAWAIIWIPGARKRSSKVQSSKV